MRLLLLALVACSHAAKPGIVFVTKENHAIDGVQIDDVLLYFQVNDRRMHEISVTRLEHVDCVGKHEPIAIIQHELHTWSSRDPVERGARRVTIPAAAAQKWVVVLTFKPFLAGCDASYEADVVVDGASRTYALPLSVEIEEAEE